MRFIQIFQVIRDLVLWLLESRLPIWENGHFTAEISERSAIRRFLR